MSLAGVAFDLHVASKAHGRGRTRVAVLADVSLSARRGDCVAIMGPSGTGKTTLVSILAGIDRGFDGTRTVTAAPIGMVFQEPRLLPWRSVGENLQVVRPGLGRAAVTALLGRCGLEPDLANRFPGALSLGQQRRVAVARALAIEPGLLILDEAFASLDTEAVAALRAVIAEEIATRGTTVVMVGHDLDDALALADRLIRLDGRPAKIVADRVFDRRRDARDAVWRAAVRSDLGG